MFVVDSNNERVTDLSGSSSMVTVLDFIEAIPFLGPFAIYIINMFSMLVFGAFSTIPMLQKMGAPEEIMILIPTLFYGIYTIAIAQFLLEVLGKRAGIR